MGLFSKAGISVPRGVFASTPAEAEQAAKKLGAPVVVKAQVLAGGRGKGHFVPSKFQGGVHVAKSSDEAADLASRMIGQKLVTKQTGSEGKPCNGVFVVEKFDIKAEKYFAILLDRGFGGPVLIGSRHGGMNIEEVPSEEIVKMGVGLDREVSVEESEKMADFMGFEGEAKKKAGEMIRGLFSFFKKNDCTLVEINPLAELTDGRVVCCDGKVNFDDNADFRQKEIHSLRDFSQEDPREVAAHEWNLNYIGLDGNVGCMVNGAGLAMATMDLLSLFGGRPANFLDVGGSAETKQIKAAFEILEKDERVKSILVNIFGGIMRCDIVAQGIIEASKVLTKPVVVRLVGTNVEEGKRIIREAGLTKLQAEDDLNKAAKLAVKLAA